MKFRTNITWCYAMVALLADARRSFATLVLLAFCLVQLSGCGVIERRFPGGVDSAPRGDFDASRIPDAVPRHEPYHPYGTRSYVQSGKRYRVLKTAKGYNKKGYASWYGSKFHGRKTSTQERYNLYAMTAASPELPLPSYVKVTNLRNGRSAVVRVNDRGPFHNRRILDLSYAAAKKLGYADSGVAPVRVEGIDPKTWVKTRHIQDGGHRTTHAKTTYARRQTPKHSPTSVPAGNFTSFDEGAKEGTFLQLGAFSSFSNAKKLSDSIFRVLGKSPHIEHKGSLYRVKIGPMADSGQLNELKQLLDEHGFRHSTSVDG